jgi:hypothetical protein
MKKYFIPLVILMVIYLAFAFVQANVDPFKWDKDVRSISAIVYIGALVLWYLKPPEL